MLRDRHAKFEIGACADGLFHGDRFGVEGGQMGFPRYAAKRKLDKRSSCVGIEPRGTFVNAIDMPSGLR